jgi:glycosyltransferase involved in cell wall biosynthesis
MKVSVLVMTYNHARFIRQCVDSALRQKLDAPYEILISEDCSTDGTREIVREYERAHPRLVRALWSETNVRTNAVVVRGVEAARGQYVALLDGDDYWLSDDKLQRQVDFLDGHPECVICFHNARVIHDDGSRPPWNWTPPDHPEITTFEDLWMGNFIATSSTVFRRGVVSPIPSWYEAYFPITDWPLHLLHAERGRIGYINEVLGVYRYHEGGYYSPLSETDKLTATLRFYERMNASTGYRHDTLARTAISKYFIEWAEEYLKRGDKAAARSCYRRYLRGRPVNRYVSLRRAILTGLNVLLPSRLTRRVRWLARRAGAARVSGRRAGAAER